MTPADSEVDDVDGMRAHHGPGQAERPCCRRAGGGGRGALVEPAALAALLGSETHGYDLRRAIADLTGGELEVDIGGLYRVLRRMEDEGYVTSAWAAGEAGPQRRGYRLTAEGRGLAEHWVTHLRERQRLSGMLADALQGALAEEKE